MELYLLRPPPCSVRLGERGRPLSRYHAWRANKGSLAGPASHHNTAVCASPKFAPRRRSRGPAVADGSTTGRLLTRCCRISARSRADRVACDHDYLVEPATEGLLADR